MMKNLLPTLCLAVLAAACGNRRMSDVELQQKIDSVNKLEVARQLKLRGIQLEETNPLQMFYDSLRLQPLPLSYSEEYVKYLPNFTVVPTAIMAYLELEGRVAPKAIALPEMLGAKLILLAADMTDGEYELWLYSLDGDYMPVDKLQIYAPKTISDTELNLPEQETHFSITSDMEIRLLEYTSDYARQGQLSVFVVDESRQFVEKQSLR